jgi:hypothetical protein
MYHEDELERTDPGSPVGDYLGIPIHDEARLRADTWDADLISVLEHQCIPHSAIYAMRAPSNLKISTIDDPTTGQIVAFVVDGTYTGPRTIWMDGRPHPSQFAAHTWSGFSTGAWEGDTLRIETTHIKAGYLRRNGIAFSDQATLTEFIDLHDKFLTLTSVAEDPVYAVGELGVESLSSVSTDRGFRRLPATSGTAAAGRLGAASFAGHQHPSPGIFERVRSAV